MKEDKAMIKALPHCIDEAIQRQSNLIKEIKELEDLFFCLDPTLVELKEKMACLESRRREKMEEIRFLKDWMKQQQKFLKDWMKQQQKSRGEKAEEDFFKGMVNLGFSPTTEATLALPYLIRKATLQEEAEKKDFIISLPAANGVECIPIQLTITSNLGSRELLGKLGFAIAKRVAILWPGLEFSQDQFLWLLDLAAQNDLQALAVFKIIIGNTFLVYRGQMGPDWVYCYAEKVQPIWWKVSQAKEHFLDASIWSGFVQISPGNSVFFDSIRRATLEEHWAKIDFILYQFEDNGTLQEIPLKMGFNKVGTARSQERLKNMRVGKVAFFCPIKNRNLDEALALLAKAAKGEQACLAEFKKELHDTCQRFLAIRAKLQTGAA